MRALIVAVPFSLLLAGCPIGTWSELENRAAYGDRIEVELIEGDLAGELILVREQDIVVLGEATGYAIPWTSIRKIDFRPPIDDYKGEGQVPAQNARRRMASASRYPYGLTDAQLAEFLEAIGQQELAPPP